MPPERYRKLVEEGDHIEFERADDLLAGAHGAAQAQARALATSAIRRAKVPAERMRAIAAALERRWQAVGYDGDYAAWIERHKPAF
jgi:hypothetical protein